MIEFLLNRLEWIIGLGLVGFGFWQVQRQKSRQQNAQKILQKAMSTATNEPATLHPEIDPAKCGGCGACTTACPEGDILQLVNHKAVLVSPSKCVGHGECERACPFNAITLVFGTKTRGVDIPRVSTHYETNVPGLYIAGELGGMGLIRNAVKQGAAAARHAFQKMPVHSAQYDLIIVGAGPAGIAAGLAAIAQKKKYLIVEQNTFGGTVANFPRQKLVMTYPADLPLVGKMKFAQNKISKEELMQYWKDIRSQTGLQIKEKTVFSGLQPDGQHFKVSTSAGDFTASKVILATGVRGTPRKLGLANEDLSKVTYNLEDPQQYQAKNICVVGGGNAGVEAAQMLANPKLKNNVFLLVRGPQFDRCNEENQKKIRDMEAKKWVQIWFDSSVTQIESNHVVVNKKGQNFKIDNDFLFVFAGAELPHKFLMSLGVKIDKKFGEALKKSG